MQVKRLVCLAVALLAIALIATPALANDPIRYCTNPKYVFYFIGDGMGSPQIHSAEAYLAQVAEPDGEGTQMAELLAMSKLSVQGMSTTFANNRFITGSAAAGTALAAGMKTNVGVISMDPSTTMRYRTLAEAAQDKGMKVGIVSSVSIDHATPAVFYAHQPSRSMYYEIGIDLADSGFDYFGGGDLKRPTQPGQPSVFDVLEANGYVYTTTREEFDALQPGTKALATTRTQNSDALAYEIDRTEGLYGDTISLAEFTAKGIELLDNDNGFFMMVEGGKIDWANHANDARASIDDTIAFDDAIKVALDFANDHPYETLIVVTADHECGGMTLGFSGTSYDTAYEMLAAQTNSFQGFNEEYFAAYKQDILDANGGSWDPVNDMDFEIKDALAQYFGLIYDDGDPETTSVYELTEFEREQLEAAYDRSLSGTVVGTAQEDWQLYGYYEPFTVTVTHILNEKAGIAFTSYSHTGAPVPVLAEGCGSLLFNGFYDNTDIARRIARALGVQIGAVAPAPANDFGKLRNTLRELGR